MDKILLCRHIRMEMTLFKTSLLLKTELVTVSMYALWTCLVVTVSRSCDLHIEHTSNLLFYMTTDTSSFVNYEILQT